MLTKKKKQFKPPRVVRRRKSLPPEMSWAIEYLAVRDNPADFARANEVELYKDRIVFVKRHPLTNERLPSTRTRLRVPIVIDGKEAKFIHRKNVESFPYFPIHWDWPTIFADPSVDIFIVESECSALSAAQHGWAAIAVGGCDGAFMTGTHRQKLHPIFSEMVLKGRRVYIIFDADADPNGNKNVHAAVQATARLFAEAVR